MNLNRRHFLAAAGATLALPWLEATGRTAPLAASPRRLVCINTTLGIHAENLFPKATGSSFELTPYLDPLKDLRGQFSLFSGLSHPDVDGGHSSEASYLTAAAHPGSSSFKNSISLDQFAVVAVAGPAMLAWLVIAKRKRWRAEPPIEPTDER